MKNLISSVSALLILAGGIANAQDVNASTNFSSATAFAKKLPAEESVRPPQESQQMPLSANASAWQKFTAQTGEWIVEWNPITGNPHRAYGGHYQIAGFPAQNASEADHAARRFLREHAAILKLKMEELQLLRAENIRNTWYLSYHQLKDGIPVLFSEVELRLRTNGTMMMFGSDFHPDLQVNTAPSISPEAAWQAASRDIKVVELISATTEEPQLYILPIEFSDHITYHLAYRFEFIASNPVGRWVAYVDAHSGNILWRFNRVRHAISGKVSAAIHRNNVDDALSIHPLPDLHVEISGQRVVTNAAGEFVHSGVGTSFNLTTKLEGKYARVTRADGASANFTLTVQNGQNVEILWDNNNSRTSERDAYFHTNIAHGFIKSIDPNFTGVDYSMPVKVNIDETCNAFWDGVGINFYRAGDGCRNTAEIPTVVYHEYGHAVNDRLYLGQGRPDGMINGAMHEGLADINAALLVDDPSVGRGFTDSGGFLRNVKNTNRYPEEVSGEVHNDGLILAGALWDLREALGLQTVREYSHFARYGTPDDPDLLTAYNEYFIEILIQDDDDGNLANLTPNFAAINQAFSAHGIGSGSLLRIAHVERVDAPAAQNDYLIQAQVSTVGFTSVNPNSVLLHYSTDSVRFVSLPMTFVVANTFQARIPHQSPGSIVSYYFSAEDNLGSSLALPYGAPQKKVFTFLVGFQSKFFDNMETDRGWKVGDVSDNATTGIWERVEPNGTKVDAIRVQPEDDHTSGVGEFCFVTGNAAVGDSNQAGRNDVDNGKTTLYSPVFDLIQYQNPVIRYYRWYSNNAGNSPGLDYWEVHLSNDSGKTWIEVERTRETDNDWRKVVFFVKKLLPVTPSMQLRFIAQDQGEGSLVEAAVDDFEILDPETVTEVANRSESTLPAELRLHANYPNPFLIGGGNGATATTIHYDLPRTSGVRVSVYDLTGRRVRLLREGVQPAGEHTLAWDGVDATGKIVGSGFYFVVMETEGRRLSRKVLVVK